jgi:hypothetical protein
MKMNNSNRYNHYIVMFLIMILAGSLTTMNIYVDKLDDVRFSLNDLYMILQMTGLMLFFMGCWYKEIYVIIFGAILSILSFTAIRNQYFIDQKQYLLGMIPHHSMAVLMSKKLFKNNNNINNYLNNIIINQTNEINYMKSKLKIM